VKFGKDILVEATFDGQIPRLRAVGRHIVPDPFDLGDDRRQASRGGVTLRDIDHRARKGAPHNVGAALGQTNVMGDPATDESA
jgi:hypothetical protein